MVQAAGNKMTMAVGRGEVAEANRIFQSAQMVMVLVCGALGILLTPLALLGPLPDFIRPDERVALLARLIHPTDTHC